MKLNTKVIDEKIGIIGLGNMGRALLNGLKRKKIAVPEKVLIFDINKSSLDLAVKDTPFTRADNNCRLTKESRIIILAVKPENITPLLAEIGESVTGDKCIISIAAGITTEFLKKHIKEKVGIIRAMPNTPGQIGAGITAISFGSLVHARDKQIAKDIFQALGEIIEIEEELMHIVTALSGSGPAYFFLIMETLVEAGKSLGLKEHIAEKLVKETALGAAKLAKTTPCSLSQLRETVTSKGGTTEKALAVLNRKGLKKIIFQAVEAALNKSKSV